MDLLPWINLALFLLLALGAQVAALHLWHRFSPYRRLLVSRRLIATLVDGTAIDGILLRQEGRLLIFANATQHSPGAQPVPMDGQVIVERERVLLLQAP